MENLPNDSPTNASEYTVSELSGALKRTVEDAFGHVRVRGEVSGYRGPHSSGHAYFCLKDERARLDAVVWKLTFQKLRFRPEEGMEVVATGRLTTYPGKSNYQIVIDNIEPAGAGALMALLEERRKRLAAEGLFDRERKRRIPYMPKVIGVVTSPTGAVIRDIIHRIADRFPVHVVVWPVRVQGETAASEVTAALAGFNALGEGGGVPRPDVLIVARGGGSLEDLWGFNDEALVRAVAASAIPVISAVGHETDWTLIDHVADLRAPTPTGAAELAVPVRSDLEAAVASLSARLRGAASRLADRRRQALRAAARALPSPDQLLAVPRRHFDELAGRLGRALEVAARRKRARLDALRLTPTSLARRTMELDSRLQRLAARLDNAPARIVRDRRRAVAAAASRLAIGPIAARVSADRRSLESLTRRQETAIADVGERRRRRLSQAGRMLETLSYHGVLQRGYAVVRNASGDLLPRAAGVKPGEAVEIEFADGKVAATTDGGAPRPKGATGARKGQDDRQGSLL